jgi:AraC-like DNA-binding protein
MKIRYTVQCNEPDEAIRAFEETLAFGNGFREIAVSPTIGTGRLTALEIDADFHVNFQFCRLRAPLEVVKEWQGDASSFVTIAFYHLQIPQKAYFRGDELVYDQEGVNIYSGGMDKMTLLFPAHSERNVVCVRIRRHKLEALLGGSQREYLGEWLRSGQFFLNEPLSPVMRRVLSELRQYPAGKALGPLFYHTRTLELIYLLLEQLNKRTSAPCKTTDPIHLAQIFKAKSLLVQDLSAPPTIAALASSVLLSESQLKQSFREVFGVSIYQYFQQARLEKAKELLAENRRTVKEVGYELGFTNIGHFSRLFERVYHVKPKKFQLERREPVA